MNAIKNQTYSPLYSNTPRFKRNYYLVSSKRHYKDFEKINISNNETSSGNKNASSTAIDSIIKLFNGTIVTGNAAGIEWGAVDYISLSGM